MIKKEDIEHLATLSRLDMTEEEKSSFSRDLDSILSYVSELTDVLDSDLVDVPNLNQNEMRNDDDYHQSGIYSQDLLASAENKSDEYIKVRKVIDK